MKDIPPELVERIHDVLEALISMLSLPRVNAADLKRLSNELAEDISLFHHRDAISVSVLSYSLYKIFSKNPLLERKALVVLISDALKRLHTPVQFRTGIRKVFDELKKYDRDIGANILHTIRHAEIKRGLKVYEHGLSIGYAAEMMGVSRWEMMDYLGSRDIGDDVAYRVDARSRLQFVRGLFK